MLLGPGVYTLGGSVELGSAVELRFQNCSIEMGLNVPAFHVPPGSKDIALTGSLEAVGNGHTAHFFRIDGTDGVDISLRGRATRLGPRMTMFLISQSTRVRLGGALRSEDSAIVRCVDSSSVDISGVQCRYKSNIAESAIRVVSTGTYGLVRGINIHDCDVDGNGNVDLFGALINVSSNTGTPPIEEVMLRNLSVRGTIKLGDGIDVGRCRYVTVSDVVGDHLNCVVSLLASDVVVTNVVGHDSRAQTVAVGDPTVQTDDQENIIVLGCISVNCGAGFSGPPGSGLGVLVTQGRSIRHVRWSHCISVGVPGGGSRYGLGVSAGAFDVRVNDCLLEGTLAKALIQAPSSEVTIE